MSKPARKLVPMHPDMMIEQAAPVDPQTLAPGESENKKKRAADSVAAAVIADHLKGSFRYHHGTGRWMQYAPDLGVWREVVQSIVWAEVVASIDDLDLAPEGYSSKYPDSVLKLLQRPLGIIRFSERLGFKNGVLVDGELVPHSPDHLLIHVLPYEFNPLATCDPIITWLHEWAKGDTEIVHILRCFMNAVVNGRADIQVFLELLGPGGAGKGTLVRLMSALVGEHASYSTELRHLEENRFEAAALKDKRLIQINDSDKYGGSVSMLKRATGYDDLRFESKGKQQGESFRPTFLVIITANEPIRSSDYTSGLSRRRITIKAENQIDMAKARDLQSEFAPFLSGLFNWVNALNPDEVARDLRSAAVEIEALAQTRHEVMLETNPVAAWAAERLFYLPGDRAKVGSAKPAPGGGFLNSDQQLFASYSEWCLEMNAKTFAVGRFGSGLEDLLVHQYKLPQVFKKTTNQGAHFFGVTLSPAPRSWGVPITLQEACAMVRTEARKVRTERQTLTPGNLHSVTFSEVSEDGEDSIRTHKGVPNKAHANSLGVGSEKTLKDLTPPTKPDGNTVTGGEDPKGLPSPLGESSPGAPGPGSYEEGEV